MRGFLIFILLLLTCASAQAQITDVPYIYYYDFLHQRMVIERADGTDSRIIPDLLPEDHNTVSFGDVSPSGRWMVVSSYHNTGAPAAYSRTLQAFTLDGETRLNLGTYPGDAFAMFWAPDEDTLLVVGSNWGTLDVRLLDVDQGVDLARFTVDNFYEEFLIGVDAYWSADSERVYLGQAWHNQIIVLQRNGEVRIHASDSLSGVNPAADFQQGVLFSRTYHSATTVSLLLQGLEDGQQVTIEDDRGREYLSVLWNPQMTYALISAQPCNDGSCEGWIKLVDWINGTVHEVLPPDTLKPLCAEDSYIPRQCGSRWSLNGRYALLIRDNLALDSDERDSLYVLDAHTGEVHPMPIYGDLFEFQWLAERLVLNFNISGLIEYDPQTEQYWGINLSSSRILGLFPSLDGQFLGISTSPTVILDRDGNLIRQIVQHSHSTASYPEPREYRWDQESSWGMADYMIFFSGGGSGPMASVVFDPRSEFQRDLPSSGGADFLPSRAIPQLSEGQPTSYTIQPEFVLPVESNRPTVAWHPTDPNELVICCDESNYAFWSLADGLPQIISAGDLDAMPAWSRSENYDIPTLVSTSDGTRLQYPVSGREVVLDSANPLGNVLRLTADLNVLLSGGADMLYYANSETGHVVLLDDMSGISNSHSADAFGTLAAISSVYRSDVRLYSTLNGHLIDRFYGTADSLAFSADGMRLATTSAGKVSIWGVSAYRP